MTFDVPKHVFALSPVSMVVILMDLSFAGPANDKSMRITTIETGERVNTHTRGMQNLSCL